MCLYRTPQAPLIHCFLKELVSDFHLPRKSKDGNGEITVDVD